MTEKKNAVDVIELIKSSGILNSSTTLDTVMNLSKQIAGSESGDPNIEAPKDWTFITADFIYTGSNVKQ